MVYMKTTYSMRQRAASRRSVFLLLSLAVSFSHGAGVKVDESDSGREQLTTCTNKNTAECGEAPISSTEKMFSSHVDVSTSTTAGTQPPTPEASLHAKRGSHTLADEHPKYRRRVGFSHQDFWGDAAPHRPYLDAFRQSLSEQHTTRAKSALQGRQPMSLGDNRMNGAKAESNESATLEHARRFLAVRDPAVEPSIYPPGGTYHQPIAVSLVTTDGSKIFYTIDGTEPDETSRAVVSGELVVMEGSGTLRAIAAHERLTLNSLSSKEVQATFVVYSEGKCGHAYFVPGFTNAGYSGKVVAVDLKTTALRSVRLHGVVTDFADFYSDAGVGPYDGQVTVQDLTQDGNSALSGYWGGFSGEAYGSTLGFLSPLYNGQDFHGNAVKVHLKNFGNDNATRFCGSDTAIGSNATCLFTVLNLEEVDADLRGFSGGFADENMAYFVPSRNGRGGSAKLVRVDAGNFSTDSVEVLDLLTVDSEVGGFFGGFASAGHGYLVPSRSFKGPVGGINTNLSVDGVPSSALLGDSTIGRAAGRLEAHYSGKLVRVNLTDFSASGVEVLDLTMVDPDLRGFSGGFSAGHWGFLVPFKNREAEDAFFGKMVRFDLRTFDLASVTVLDLTQVAPSLRGFVGGFTHGRYAILPPYANGNRTSNYRSRSQFSEMVAVDLNDFTPEGVFAVDLAATSRQQIPYQPDPNLRGYVGGFSLGPHVYLTPHFNGVFFGKVVRVDMREMLTMAAGERAASYDGLQVLDLEYESSDFLGFSGAFHSRHTSCT